jgi:hypothetical protein
MVSSGHACKRFCTSIRSAAAGAATRVAALKRASWPFVTCGNSMCRSCVASSVSSLGCRRRLRGRRMYAAGCCLAASQRSTSPCTHPRQPCLPNHHGTINKTRGDNHGIGMQLKKLVMSAAARCWENQHSRAAAVHRDGAFSMSQRLPSGTVFQEVHIFA